MKTKVFLVVLLISVLFGGLLWSSGADEGADEGVNLTFLHRWPQEPYAPFFEEVVADFEALNPGITVDIQTVANNPFKEKIKVVVGTDEAPDVFFTWPGEFTNRFIRENLIYDLSAEMKAGWQDDFVPSQLEPFMYNDGIYGTPFRVDGKVFAYNKAIFKEVGVDVPETWEEFLEVCKKIDDAGYIPIAFGNISPWAISHYIGTMNQKIVGEAIHDAYDPAIGDFSDPGFVKALEEYQKLIPYFNANPNTVKHDEAQIRFFIGREAAMHYFEIVELGDLEKAALDANDPDFVEDYGIFKFPDISWGKGDQDALTGYPEGFVVSAKSKHPAEAVAFLKYLTGRTVGEKEAKELGFLNGIKNIIDPSQMNQTYYDAAQIVLNSSKLVNWLDSGMHAQVTNMYLSELQRLTDGLATPEEVMANVSKVAKEVADNM